MIKQNGGFIPPNLRLLWDAQSAAVNHFFTRYVQQVGSLQQVFCLPLWGAWHHPIDPDAIK